MPERQEPRNELSDKAATDYLRGLLRKRGIETLSCPICGGHDWEGAFDAAVHIIEGRDTATGEVEGIAGSAHAIGVTCTRCGYMTFFDRDVIGD